MLAQDRPTTHSGYLTKLGRKDNVLGKSWKRRFFVLSTSTLFYYTDESRKQEKGSVNLLAASVVPKLESYVNRNHAFEISTPSRNLMEFADSEEDALCWIRIIQETAEVATEKLYAKYGQSSGGSSNNKNKNMSNNSSNSSNSSNSNKNNQQRNNKRGRRKKKKAVKESNKHVHVSIRTTNSINTQR